MWGVPAEIKVPISDWNKLEDFAILSENYQKRPKTGFTDAPSFFE